MPPVDLAKLPTVADQIAALGADDEVLALVQTLDPAELAWLTAEFGQRAASMRRGAAWFEDGRGRAPGGLRERPSDLRI